jgi:tight adherence protein C
MLLFLQISLSIILGALGIAFIFLAIRSLSSGSLNQRLTQYVEAPLEEGLVRKNVVRIQPRIITGSFASRIFMPVLRGIGRFFGRITPTGAIDNLAKQLLMAGNPMGLGPREFYGISMALTVLGVYLAFVMYQRGTGLVNLLLCILILILFYAGPKVWLHYLVTNRQKKVLRGLPDALDMLSVCATAGLGFDQSLQRVSEYWDTPIGHEFGRVINEMEMGLTRREALRNLAERVDIREISSFVALIIQTEQLGMSISDTLHAQAEQMRIERRHRAQEQAQKAPIKMLLPMVLLIFPALLAVILGPAIPTLMEVFRNL